MKFNLKRKLAGILAVLMVLFTITCDRTVMSVNAENGITVSFPNGLVNGNMTSYTVGEETVTVTVSGGDIAGSSVTVPHNDLASVTFTLSDNFNSDTMQVKVTAPDGFGTTLAVNEQRVTSLANKTNDGGLPDTLELTVESMPNDNGGDNPGPGDNGNPNEENTTWELDLKIGDKEYYGIQGDHSYLIDNIEDVKSITVLRQKKNDEDWVDSIATLEDLGLSGQSMSTVCYDEQGRGTLEVFTIASGDSSVTLNLQSHYWDSWGVDEIEDFYVGNITFYEEEYVGVTIEQQGPAPDMFSNLSFSNKVDISDTTEESPAVLQQYFANDTFKVAGVAGGIKKVEPAANINPAAVTIKGDTVTFNSNFYDEVTFKITMNDGTVGYITVKRLGLTIQEDGIRNNPKNYVFHGTQLGYDWSGTEYANKANIVGTFYYDSAESYKDYHVIATLTYADGSVETKEVAGIGETYCVDRSLKGGDYILYSGTKEDAPVRVSATVVHTNAIKKNSFGGACFGNGAGVTYDVEKN